MSTMRVNLLPREYRERERARRARALAVLGGLVFVAVLAGLYLLQVGRVNDAEARLAEEQAETQRLQSRVQELNEFAELNQRLEAANARLVTTMGREVSMAGILQDIAAVTPTDAALTGVDISISPQPQQSGQFDVGGPSNGRISGSGEVLRGHAPGVERFLLEFEKIAAFFDVFVSSSNVDEEGVATFSFETDLGPEIFTRRYVDGLPEGLR
ncbi:MAG: PilN domain-containing protein [Nitriliruptorales bacterium]